jgi:hypothetical protein
MLDAPLHLVQQALSTAAGKVQLAMAAMHSMAALN